MKQLNFFPNFFIKFCNTHRICFVVMDFIQIFTSFTFQVSLQIILVTGELFWWQKYSVARHSKHSQSTFVWIFLWQCFENFLFEFSVCIYKSFISLLLFLIQNIAILTLFFILIFFLLYHFRCLSCQLSYSYSLQLK